MVCAFDTDATGPVMSAFSSDSFKSTETAMNAVGLTVFNSNCLLFGTAIHHIQRKILCG